MRKLIIVLVIIVLLLGIGTYGINYYLTPDDLAGCDQVITRDNDSPCAPADAIVAVSGGDTINRAKRAVDLYNAGWAPVIIFSGGAADPNSESNAKAMYTFAVESGVGAGDIGLDEDSKNTAENATNSVKLLRAMGAKNVILVSSPYHLRRVAMNFSAADSNIKFRTTASVDSRWDNWFIRPSGWWLAAQELGGIVETSTRGIR